ncbi:MAG: ribonuclease III [Anaerolineales bacterium]
MSDEERKTESPVELAARLSLPFDDLRLLTRALTHSSYINEHPTVIEDNERLEFLGDAVLDFLVGSWVYQHYPEMREGDMTRMRSALVRTESLAAFARRLNLGAAMRLGRGELFSGGRDRDLLLCCTFEALVGAIYQHKGLDAVRNFVIPLFEPAAEQLYTKMRSLDSKSALQEWSQANGRGIPRYETSAAEGPEHAKVFEVKVYLQEECLGVGTGPSKHAAQQSAAQNALEKIVSS